MPYINIKVLAYNHEELRSFLRLCSTISQLGITGCSRDLCVHVDGDGTGRLYFETFGDGEEPEQLVDLDNISEFDPDAATEEKIYIGG